MTDGHPALGQGLHTHFVSTHHHTLWLEGEVGRGALRVEQQLVPWEWCQKGGVYAPHHITIPAVNAQNLQKAMVGKSKVRKKI